MTHPFDTDALNLSAPPKQPEGIRDEAIQAAIRSWEAETVVQAAYGSRGAARHDGLMETLVTVFATIVFGLGWASIESGALAERPPETGYAATASLSQFPSSSSGAALTKGAPGVQQIQWTEKPLARSK